MADRPSLAAPYLEWCREQIGNHCAHPFRIVTIRSVPSRTAEVYRLAVETPNGDSRFYLKCYPSSKSRTDLRQRFDRLALLADAFQHSGVVPPYRAVGFDAERGLLLATETAGDSLLAIHRSLSRRLGFGNTDAAVRAWYGVGVWLRTLHWCTTPPTQSATRVQEVHEYTSKRLRDWANQAPSQRALAKCAVETLEMLAAQAARQPVTITLCHGDISTGNVIVGDAVGLVDLDDLRPDMPAVDISQVLMELREFGFVASVVPLRGFAKAARTAFVAGYGHPLPEGPEFWLPHLRNLSVYLLTLARRCRGIGMYRVSEEMRYRRTIRELKRCMKESQSSGGATAYPV